MYNKLYTTEKLEILEANRQTNISFKISEPFDTIEDTKHYNQKFNIFFLTDKFELHSRPLDRDGKMYLFNNYGFDTARGSLFNNNKIFPIKKAAVQSYIILKFKELETWESINNKRLNLLNTLNSN